MKILNFALYGTLLLATSCTNSSIRQSNAPLLCPESKFPSVSEIEKMSTSMLRIKYRTAEVEKETLIYSKSMGNDVCPGEGLYVDAWRSILVDRLKNESVGLYR